MKASDNTFSKLILDDAIGTPDTPVVGGKALHLLDGYLKMKDSNGGTFQVIEPGASLGDIGDPALATAEDCANKINELLAILRAAGLVIEVA